MKILKIIIKLITTIIDIQELKTETENLYCLLINNITIMLYKVIHLNSLLPSGLPLFIYCHLSSFCLSVCASCIFADEKDSDYAKVTPWFN